MMKKRLIAPRALGLLTLAALACLGGAAWAEQALPLPRPQVSLIEGLSIEEARALLTQEHYRAETVAAAAPYLKTRAGETYFFVSLYDCADAAKAEGCRTLELTTGAFTIRPAPSGEELARWNAASPFGFGVFDSSGSPYLRALLPLAGGVAPAHVKAMLTLWTAQVSAFSKFVEASAAPPAIVTAPAVQNAAPAAAAPASTDALH
jgi:hypothetical protein